jgi:AraC-like DNA-binding protein
MLDQTIKTRLLLRPIRSAIGTIRLAGINQGGIGVGVQGHPLRVITYYCLNYVMHGEGTYRDRHHRSIRVAGEHAALSFPGIPYSCGTAPGTFWDEFWFEFEGPVFDLMRRTGVLDPKRPVHHAAGRDYWFRRLFTIVPPQHLRQKTSPEVIIMRFVSLLTEMLAGHAPAEDPQPQDDWVATACGLLADAENSAAGSIADVARQLGLTYENFRKKFRAAVGYSPGQFHLDARIDRAAALLYQGRQSIKEIAVDLNFCDEFYFSRCFKRRFGQSPRHFRQRVRGA